MMQFWLPFASFFFLHYLLLLLLLLSIITGKIEEKSTHMKQIDSYVDGDRCEECVSIADRTLSNYCLLVARIRE